MHTHMHTTALSHAHDVHTRTHAHAGTYAHVHLHAHARTLTLTPILMLTYTAHAGTHHVMGPPQLELVKQACQIFALDDDVKNEVANMKRALLRVLKVHVCKFTL